MASFKLVTRPAHRGDADDIVALYSEFRPDWKVNPRLLDALKKYPAFVLTDGQRIAGFSYCFSFAPDILELANIYIAARYRGQDHGSKLLSAIEKAAGEKGYRAIILNNSSAYPGKEGVKTAEAFYLHNGYRLMMKTEKTFVFAKDL